MRCAVLLTALAISFSASANLVADDDFEGAPSTNNPYFLAGQTWSSLSSNISQWYATGQWLVIPLTGPGEGQLTDTSANTYSTALDFPNQNLFQVIHNHKQSTGSFVLKFDYFVQDDGLDFNGPTFLNYDVIGFQGSSLTLLGGLFHGIWGGTRLANPTNTLLVDTTGLWQRHESVIDLGSGYEWIVVVFRATYSHGDGNAAGVDDITLAPVPEPAALALIALAPLALLRRSRRPV